MASSASDEGVERSASQLLPETASASASASEESVLGDAVEEVLRSHLPPSHWRTLQLILT